MFITINRNSAFFKTSQVCVLLKALLSKTYIIDCAVLLLFAIFFKSTLFSQIVSTKSQSQVNDNLKVPANNKHIYVDQVTSTLVLKLYISLLLVLNCEPNSNFRNFWVVPCT